MVVYVKTHLKNVKKINKKKGKVKINTTYGKK